MGNGGKGWLVASVFVTLAGCGGASTGGQPGISAPVQTAGVNNNFGNETLGEIQPIQFSGTTANLNFANSTDDYLVILNSTIQNGNDLTVQLGKSSGVALTSEPAALEMSSDDPVEDAATAFHNYMREMETVLQESGDYEAVTPRDSSFAALGETLAVGDSESFRILSTMNSITTFKEVSATLRVATDDLQIFVDESDGDAVSDEDLQKLAHEFGDIALPRERALFGKESDINLDGHITIVMSCVVNGMASSGGIVTGFFFPGDLYARSTYNPVSNTREIFYVLKPDSRGQCGTPIASDFAINQVLPGVLAHEYQHMTSFNQHVFKNRGSTEEAWLNECLSHLSEDLTGYNQENPSRMKLFFNQPSKTSIVSVTSPTLAERGACYTFLRYLYEQSPNGDEFISNLYKTAKTGVDNLQTAFNGSDSDFDEFPEFVNRWSIALSLSGTGITSDPRYNYQDRSLNPDTSSYTGMCVRCDAQDGRGTVLDGPVFTSVSTYPNTAIMKGTASQFYRLQSPSDSVRLTVPAGSAMTGSVIRLTKN